MRDWHLNFKPKNCFTKSGKKSRSQFGPKSTNFATQSSFPSLKKRETLQKTVKTQHGIRNPNEHPKFEIVAVWISNADILSKPHAWKTVKNKLVILVRNRLWFGFGGWYAWSKIWDTLFWSNLFNFFQIKFPKIKPRLPLYFSKKLSPQETCGHMAPGSVIEKKCHSATILLNFPKN